MKYMSGKDKNNFYPINVPN